MDAELGFQKALMLVDRGETARAQDVLRSLLDADPSPVLRVQTLVVLGDLHAADGGSKAAREALSEALARADSIEDADDVLDTELDRARELLHELS